MTRETLDGGTNFKPRGMENSTDIGRMKGPDIPRTLNLSGSSKELALQMDIRHIIVDPQENALKQDVQKILEEEVSCLSCK